MEIIGIARYCHNPACEDVDEWPLLPGDDAFAALRRLRARPVCPACGETGSQVQFAPRWTPYAGPGRQHRREWPEGCYMRIP